MTATPKELTDQPKRAANPPFALLDEVLSAIRLEGAIFLRAEYSAPWAYESPSCSDLTALLRPDAKRLVLFHIVAEGACWIRVGGDRLDVAAGDVVVLPYADQHTMGSTQPANPVPIASLLPAPPWAQLPVIRYGGGGSPTKVVCGYLCCSDLLFDPVVRALPPLFKVRPPAGPAAAWIAASIQYALDASIGERSRHDALALRLPELLFGEVLRLYVQSGSPELRGWLAALGDPVVGPALQLLHAEPAHGWTVQELAARSASSRSILDDRCRRLLGQPPMRYLTELRLRLAAGMLRDTTLGVAAVANRIGYESEEAFNRAFKRLAGESPARWRRRATAAYEQ